jgi:WD40 repeat protein
VAARDLIFISYSHLERDWLDRLLVFLKPYVGPNFEVWADPYIKDGADWRRDITKVLGRSCVGILLVSPDFLASDFIRKEELPPLLAGAEAGTISLFPIPISASNYKATPLRDHQFAHPPSRPLDGMPRPRRHAALVRITEKIAAEVERIRSEIPSPPVKAAEPAPSKSVAPVVAIDATGALHGVPSQRPNYLRRQEYFDRVKRALLGPTQQAVGITGATQGGRIGLHGMGGIGKTVLAIDLVNDEQVRRAFPDGIFWLTLGQTIEPLQLQGELAAYIVGEPRAFATINQARDGLHQLFEGKACLLVLDNLWRPQDAEPFDVLGPRSRLLVTTRDADLLVALGAKELPLEVLGEDLALELLASWSSQPRAELPEAARHVAGSCGYLPLALALAGARVQGGVGWEEVLSALERGRLEFLDHSYGSVFSSLRLSTDALTVSDQDRYFELAVFPEDADIPVETVCTLWRHTGRVEPDISRDLLRRLHRRALLTLHADGSGISFHDLQHDFLRLNIPSLTKGHEALVDAYRAVSMPDWASGPDDGYFFQHLLQHLFAAERLDELRALLCDYDWLAAKLRATTVTAILADYDLVARDQDLVLIQQALRLSIPVLSRDSEQLPAQLFGRLQGFTRPPVETLLAGAEQGPDRAWLCPRFPSLTPPGGPLRQILFGHTDWVHAVAVLMGGRRAISGSADTTLRVWDLVTGESLRTLEGHTGWVSSVAVLTEDSRALSASGDGTLRLWDLETGETLRTLEGHTNAVFALDVLSDGHRALSASGDGTLRLWDLETGETLRTLEGHTAAVHAVALLANGGRVLSGSRDNTLRLWDLATGETLRTFEGHTAMVNGVAVLLDGDRAVSASHDGTLRLWDLETGETLRTLEGHTAPVTTLTVLDDGDRVLSGSQDHTLRLWDLATGKTLQTLRGHTFIVHAVTTVPGGRRALSGSYDKTLRLWDLGSAEDPEFLKGHAGSIEAATIVPQGNRALSGSWDTTLRLWDLASGESLRTLEGHTEPVMAVAALADGSRALSGSYDKTLRLWDLCTGETLRTLKGHTETVSAVAMLADGRRALSGSHDKTLRLWDLASGETLRIYKGHENWVTAVALLADENRAVSGSSDGTLRLWDLASGERLYTFEGHFWVSSVAVLAAENRILSGAFDRTLRLWDLATGEVLRTFEGHSSAVYAVAVGGARALSGSTDNTLRLWDLATGECLAVYTADGAINCVAVAPDDLVVAGSADGKVHILEIREP